ncbi:MAG TPA: RNA 3'-terminal phosphate cyclase, partial [Myxococcota bacterium]|nr:RNA 3'-terminal phosphate cyclase [Myxococcota bacterium]
LVANLPRGIGERELATLRARIPGLEDAAVVEVRGSRGPGNALLIEVESEHVREMFTSFGERGVPARTVADRLAREALAYLGSDAPVGPHLADQLIVPLALAGDGEFRTLPLTTHFATNVSIVERFLPVRVRWAEEASGSVRVELR